MTFYIETHPEAGGCRIISSTLLMQCMMRRLYSVDGDFSECIWCSYRVDADIVADISEAHAAYIFRVAVCRDREF
jgi:hypothetical protein